MSLRARAWACAVAGAAGCLSACDADPVDEGAEPLLAPPERGHQIQFGPFDVPPRDASCVNNGTLSFEGNCGEVQLCRTLKLNNEEPIAINRLDVAMNQGSHHFIIFRSTHDFPDQVFPCWGTVNFDLWDFVVDVNRTGGFDWQLSDDQAFVLEPHQQIMMQTHFVNASTVQTPVGGMVTVNLHQTELDSVDKVVHGKFVVNNTIVIPPHSSAEFTRRCTFDQSVGLVAMTAHFHARGKEFKVRHVGPELTTQPEFDIGPLYLSENWDAPIFTIFEEPIEVFRNEGVRFDCSYFNATTEPIGYGGHAETQEHCNLFFHYYQMSPFERGPLQCTDGPNGK